MDRYKFEVDDTTKIQTMQLYCSRCRAKPKEVPALVFHAKMTVERDSDTKKDIIAIFCQGRSGCDGQAWAFPVEPDNAIVRKHNALPTLTTDN